MVDNTSAIARLANRVLMIAKQEADNSEEPDFIARVNNASDQVHACKCCFISLIFLLFIF